MKLKIEAITFGYAHTQTNKKKKKTTNFPERIEWITHRKAVNSERCHDQVRLVRCLVCSLS